LVAGCDYNDFILPGDNIPQQDAGNVGNTDGGNGAFVPPTYTLAKWPMGGGSVNGPNGNIPVVVDGGGLVPPNQFPTDSGVSPDEFVELDSSVRVDSAKPDQRYYFPPIWPADGSVVVSPDSGVPAPQDSGTTSQDADTHQDSSVAIADTGVSPDTSIPTTCGNGVVDLGEDCDGSDLADRNCRSLGFPSGTLACGADCKYDLDTCSCYKNWKHEKVCKKYKSGKGHKKDCWKNKNCCKVNRGCGWGCK